MMAGLFAPILGAIGGAAGALGNLGGSSAKTDRGNFLNAIQGQKNVYNWALPFGQAQGRAGQATTAAGVGNLGEAGNYYRQLASGNRTAALEAAAPAANAALAQSDAQKRELGEMGTARGGGVAGVNQQRDSQMMANIDNMLFGARGAGAAGLANVGQAEAGVGLGQTGQGIEAGQLAQNSAATTAGQSMYSRALSEQIHQQHVKQFTDSFKNLLSGLIPTGSKGGGFNDTGTGQPG